MTEFNENVLADYDLRSKTRIAAMDASVDKAGALAGTKIEAAVNRAAARFDELKERHEEFARASLS